MATLLSDYLAGFFHSQCSSAAMIEMFSLRGYLGLMNSPWFLPFIFRQVVVSVFCRAQKARSKLTKGRRPAQKRNELIEER